MSVLDRAGPVWAQFPQWLPLRPYCTDDPRHGLIIRSRDVALRYSHIQFNHPFHMRWLCFDIDRKTAAFDWEDRGLPAPTVIVQNPCNGHAHLAYALKKPVWIDPRATPAAMRYAQAVERGIARRVGSDPDFSALILKNPLSLSWRSRWLVAHPYLLDQLAGYLTDDEMRPARAALEPGALGRNCELFDSVRTYAYSAVLAFKRDGNTCSGWIAHLENQLTKRNQLFSEPLPDREVRGIARSIGRWTWREFTENKFVTLQQARSSAASVQRKRHAASTTVALRALLSDMDDFTLNISQLARRLGVSRPTVYSHLKRIATEDASKEQATRECNDDQNCRPN